MEEKEQQKGKEEQLQVIVCDVEQGMLQETGGKKTQLPSVSTAITPALVDLHG